MISSLSNSRWSVTHVFWTICLCSIVGCAEERATLHEMDHYVPPHWPKDLTDGADKIEQRAKLLPNPQLAAEARQQATLESADLVEWMPEIAADTDLSEAQWLPIYERCRAIERQLESPGQPSEAISASLLELAALLRTANAQLLAASEELPGAPD